MHSRHHKQETKTGQPQSHRPCPPFSQLTSLQTKMEGSDQPPPPDRAMGDEGKAPSGTQGPDMSPTEQFMDVAARLGAESSVLRDLVERLGESRVKMAATAGEIRTKRDELKRQMGCARLVFMFWCGCGVGAGVGMVFVLVALYAGIIFFVWYGGGLSWLISVWGWCWFACWSACNAVLLGMLRLVACGTSSAACHGRPSYRIGRSKCNRETHF